MKKYLLINTKDRNNNYKSSSNFRINLPTNIDINEYIKLKYMVIPKCNYLFNDYNNLINIIIGGTLNTIIIPNRQFKPDQLAQFFQQRILGPYSFNCIYYEDDYKFHFSASVNFSIDFSLSDVNKLFNMERKLYFSDNNNYIITNTINFNKPYYLNMILNNITSSNFINSNGNQSITTSFNIPSNSKNFGDFIEYNDYKYNIKLAVNNPNLHYLDITLLDDEDRIYDNQNQDWYCVFEYK